MKNFHFLASGVDVNPLMLAIRRRPDLWKEDTFLRHYPQGPFGETETIMLRFPEKVEGLTEEQIDLYKQNQLAGYDQYEAIDYPPYKVLHEARPLVRDLMARVAGERLGRVMINKIVPGGRIFAHADTPEQTRYYTLTGECFWFDNSQVHSVENNSADERVSMVVDVRTSR
jgi:hypothetical protein